MNKNLIPDFVDGKGAEWLIGAEQRGVATHALRLFFAIAAMRDKVVTFDDERTAKSGKDTFKGITEYARQATGGDEARAKSAKGNLSKDVQVVWGYMAEAITADADQVRSIVLGFLAETNIDQAYAELKGPKADKTLEGDAAAFVNRWVKAGMTAEQIAEAIAGAIDTVFGG